MLINQEKENFGDAITGVHSAIKQYVDASKGTVEWGDSYIQDSDEEDRGTKDKKKKILQKAIDKNK